MAIINTFPKCLDSPYLIADKDAHARVGTLMATAADRLEAAANINHTGQGDMADVTFLSYEAMFSCLRALVYHKGYREMGLRCLMLACEHLYVRQGLLDAGTSPSSAPRGSSGPRPRTSPLHRRSSSGRSRSCAAEWLDVSFVRWVRRRSRRNSPPSDAPSVVGCASHPLLRGVVFRDLYASPPARREFRLVVDRAV